MREEDHELMLGLTLLTGTATVAFSQSDKQKSKPKANTDGKTKIHGKQGKAPNK